MGIISESLARQMKDNVDALSQIYSSESSMPEIEVDGIIDEDQIIDEGFDPVHAAYISVQNFTSYFAESLSMLPDLKAYCDIVGPAEEEYMPSGPPMSPLTASHFTCWAFFDARFGPDEETIGTCFLDIILKLNILPDMVSTLETMQNSRMGIYEHMGFKDDKVILQELMTQEKRVCYVPAGYAGEKGELWFVRVLPPVHESIDYSIVFTTPYVLIKETKDNWIAFLNRVLLAEKQTVGSYQEFMKYGLNVNYWNEFIFLSYVNNLSSAIFLAGLPDIQASLYHSDLAKTVRKIARKTPKTTKKKRRR